MYPNPRTLLVAALERGEAPDSQLLAQNQLRALGVDARIHESRLARERSSWLRWQLREIVVPWEVGDADLMVTPLFRYVGFSSRIARGPKVVVLNFGLNVLLRHTTRSRRRVVRAALRAASLVVNLSDVQRDDLLELSGLPEDRVATVRLGTDATFFTPSSRPTEDLVLTVGNDLARDFRTFCDAVAPLQVEGRVATLPRNVTGAVLPANVTAALATPLELRDLYARAGCVVISQHGDAYHDGTEHGGTQALLEAMAMAKAVVLTERAPLREYVDDDVTALVVPPKDPEALRAAVERVLGDAALRARLGAAARARVEREFTTRHMAERFRPVLEAL